MACIASEGREPAWEPGYHGLGVVNISEYFREPSARPRFGAVLCMKSVIIISLSPVRKMSLREVTQRRTS